jgi:hypothetical protein
MEDAALVMLYALVASGQVTLRKIDGHQLTRAVLAKTIVLKEAAWERSAMRTELHRRNR